ncbi:hypothetical protein BJX68DRAFT_271192 [Aspergillus pseudodeflectus]|uniref:C2H2-type domain-containing protein n=1 Tax=Aspergillus pseudodeflectus TaxID=176178 RepID=A0ABR4JMQ1_9EURO
MSQMLRGRNTRHASATRRAQHTLPTPTRCSRTPFLSLDTNFSTPADHYAGSATPAGAFDQYFLSPLSPYNSFRGVSSAASRPENDISQIRQFDHGSGMLQGTMGYDNYGEAVANTHSAPCLSASGTSTDPSPTSSRSYSGGSQAVAGHNHLFGGEYFDGGHIVLRCKWEGCDYSGGFRRTHDLKRHVLTQHIEPRSHECPEYGCGMSFNRRDNLRWHLRRVHQRVENS